jgi:SnoaL-like domain
MSGPYTWDAERDRLSRLEDSLQLLLDREAIRDVLYRYCRAIDHRDRELLASVYHLDAIDEHGSFCSGQASDFIATAMDTLETVLADAHTQHSLGTIVIEVDGNRASSESYFRAPTVLPHHDRDGGARVVRELVGRWLDEFEKRDGEWRITHRRVVKDCHHIWLWIDAIEDDGFPTPELSSNSSFD